MNDRATAHAHAPWRVRLASPAHFTLAFAAAAMLLALAWFAPLAVAATAPRG